MEKQLMLMQIYNDNFKYCVSVLSILLSHTTIISEFIFHILRFPLKTLRHLNKYCAGLFRPTTEAVYMNRRFNCIFSTILHEICGFHRCADQLEQTDQPCQFHRHNAYEICLILHGNVNVDVEQRCFRMTCGDMLIIYPGEMHRCAHSNGQDDECIVICLKHSALERLSTSKTNLASCFEFHQICQNHLFHLSQAQTWHFTELADELFHVLKSTGFGCDILADSYSAQLLIFLNRLFQSPPEMMQSPMPKLVHDTVTYVKEHLNEKITLNQLSQELYMNKSYISSQFKKYMGIPLRSYILGQRIILAKQLLRNGEDVGEACDHSGFSDYSNFIRSFTNVVGVSPGKFKRRTNHVCNFGTENSLNYSPGHPAVTIHRQFGSTIRN